MNAFFVRTAALLAVALPWAALSASDTLPQANPVAARYPKATPAWTSEFMWTNVINIRHCKGADVDAQLKTAQESLAAKGGGVVFFPAGTYAFKDNVRLKSGIVIRGETPQGATDAKDDKYALATKFEFPRYRPTFEGNGTPNDTAFKGISLEDAASGTRIGIVNVDLNFAHIGEETGSGVILIFMIRYIYVRQFS